MGKYIKLFNSHQAYEDFTESEDLILPNVSRCDSEKDVHYSPRPDDYQLDQYLTFEALEEGTFTLTIPASVNTNYVTSVSYSINDGVTWTTVQNTSSSVTITTPTIQSGSKVLWKGMAIAYASGLIDSNSIFSSTGNFKASGNIMSLLYGDNFINSYMGFPTNSNLNFYNLFRYCKITVAPLLPATTLMGGCYRGMFQGCISLTASPTLSATTLANSCYQYMFQGCSSINSVTCLATDISATNCTDYWLNNVSSSGTFIKAASMTSWSTGISGIPTNWTVVDAS